MGVDDSLRRSGIGGSLGGVKSNPPVQELGLSQAERDSTRSMGVAHCGQRKHGGRLGVWEVGVVGWG